MGAFNVTLTDKELIYLEEKYLSHKIMSIL